MELNNYKLGELIEECTEKNSDLVFSLKDVKGISIKKEFIETKADMEGVSLSPYLIVRPDYFAYVTVTSRNGEKITLAHNNTENTYIVSSSYVVFKVSRPDILNSEYLFMYFNRPEFDRYARFNSWGSARETFSWDDMREIYITLPDLPTQGRFVKIYKSLMLNLSAYQSKVERLKYVCEIELNRLNSYDHVEIARFIERNNKKNKDRRFSKSEVKGFDNDGRFIKPMRLFSGEISTFQIIQTNDFVYNSMVNSTIKKLSIAFNEGDDVIVSPAYESFHVTDESKLYPYYLYMLLQNENFAKRVLFNSFGSATTFFDIDSLGNIKIPVPPIEIQIALANLYKCRKESQLLMEKIKTLINNLCPIFIRGSLLCEK